MREHRYTYWDDSGQRGPFCWECVEPRADELDYWEEDFTDPFTCVQCGREIWQPFTRLVSVALPIGAPPTGQTWQLNPDMSGWTAVDDPNP